jgi:hypothetical protein
MFLDQFVRQPMWHILRRSDYRVMLNTMDAEVPKERGLVLFFERLFSDESLKRLCGFLDIGFRPGAYDRVVNGGDALPALREDVETVLQERLAPVYRDLAARFGQQLPDEWHNIA